MKGDIMPFVLLVSVIVICITWAGIAATFSDNDLKSKKTELDIQREKTKQLQMDYELAKSRQK